MANTTKNQTNTTNPLKAKLIRAKKLEEGIHTVKITNAYYSTEYGPRAIFNLETLTGEPIKQRASFNLASKRGLDKACEFLGDIIEDLSIDDVEKALPLAAGIVVRASVEAENGYLNVSISAINSAVLAPEEPVKNANVITEADLPC